jgi:hypothetical protein
MPEIDRGNIAFFKGKAGGPYDFLTGRHHAVDI